MFYIPRKGKEKREEKTPNPKDSDYFFPIIVEGSSLSTPPTGEGKGGDRGE